MRENCPFMYDKKTEKINNILYCQKSIQFWDFKKQV